MPEKYQLGTPFQGGIKGGLEKIRLPRPESLKVESEELYNDWSNNAGAQAALQN